MRALEVGAVGRVGLLQARVVDALTLDRQAAAALLAENAGLRRLSMAALGAAGGGGEEEAAGAGGGRDSTDFDWAGGRGPIEFSRRKRLSAGSEERSRLQEAMAATEERYGEQLVDLRGEAAGLQSALAVAAAALRRTERERDAAEEMASRLGDDLHASLALLEQARAHAPKLIMPINELTNLIYNVYNNFGFRNLYIYIYIYI